MRIISVLLMLMAIGSANAQASGEATYAPCAACHGGKAEGNEALNAPRLAHLEPVYIVAQLQKFRAGVRGGADDTATAQQMATMANTVADEQAVTAVATYIGSLEAAPAKSSLQGDAAAGGDYYNQFCGACHGGTAQGNVALNSPRLAGADDWYLQAQLNAFRSGTRGSHPDDKTGRQMRAMASLLPDEKTVTDVVVFINSLAP